MLGDEARTTHIESEGMKLRVSDLQSFLRRAQETMFLAVCLCMARNWKGVCMKALSRFTRDRRCCKQYAVA